MVDEISIRWNVDSRELDQSARKVQDFGPQSDRALKQAGGGVKGLLGGISQVGFAIFGLQQSFMGLKSVVGGLFSSNIQFEQMEVQFEVLLGSAEAARNRMDELAQFGKDTPFELPNVVRASKILQTFGGDALATGEGLRLVGDVASGVGINIDELAMWFGRLYDGLQSGRPVGEAMMRLQEMGAMSGETRGQIEAMAEAGVEGSIVWDTFAESMGKYSGMMEKQSQTVGGAMSNIADGFNMMKRNLMAGIFEAAKPGIMGFATWLGSDGVQGAVKGAGLAIGEFVNVSVAGLTDGIRLVIDPLKEFADIVDGPIRDGIGWLADTLPEIASGTLEWANEHRGLLVLLGPTGLALRYILDNWDELKQKVSEGISFGKGLFDDIRGEFESFISSFTSSSYSVSLGDKLIFGKTAAEWGFDARQTFNDVAASVGILTDALSDAGDEMSAAFGQLLTGDFAAAWSTIRTAASGFVTDIQKIDAVKATFDAIGDSLQALNDSIAPAVAIWKPLVKDIFVELQAAVGPIVQAFKNDLLPALRELAPVGQAIGSALLPVLEMLGKVLGITLVVGVTAFLLIIRQFVQYIGDAVPIAIKTISLAFEIIGSGIKAAAIVVETGAKIITGVIDTIVALIHGDWSKAWEEFTGIFKDAWEGLKDLAALGWETFKTALTEWLPAIFGIGKDILMMFFDGLMEPWNKWVFPFFKGMATQVVQAVGSGLGWLVQTGKDIVSGLWEGLVSMKDWLKGKAEEMAGWIPKWVRDILGIGSPSKVFIEIGKDTMLGFQIGLEEGADGVESFWQEFMDKFKDSTATGMDMWSNALKIGLESGAHMTTDTISNLFADLYAMVNDSGLDAAGKATAQAYISGLISEFGASGSLANKAVMDFIDAIKSGATSALGGAVPGWAGGTSTGASATGSLGADWGKGVLNTFRNASMAGVMPPEIQSLLASINAGIATDKDKAAFNTWQRQNSTSFTDIQGIMSAVQQGWVTANQLTPEEIAAVKAQYARFGPDYKSSSPNIQVILESVTITGNQDAESIGASLGYGLGAQLLADGV